MSRNHVAVTLSLALVFTVGLGTVTTADAQRFEWPEKSENLTVLPKDFPAQRLRAVMTGFSRALGVRCSHCHVGEEGQPLTTFDFPSDENPKKDVARKMLKMLGSINDDLKEIEPSGPERVNMWCHTCHHGQPRPMRLAEALAEVYEKDGVDAAIARYRDLRERFYGSSSFDFREGSLNSMGYGLLGKKKYDEAIKVFLLNVEHFPESGNVYDSLAEAYMAKGDNDLAVTYYEKALALDPKNRNATAKLKELRGDRK